MKVLLLALSLLSAPALADTFILDPGPGTLYLARWCGGQSIDEVATGFNAGGTANVVLRVSARCSTGGRGTHPKTYTAVWSVTFFRDGEIAYALPGGTWPADPLATFTDTDGALLSTTTVYYVSGSARYGYRAVLSTP